VRSSAALFTGEERHGAPAWRRSMPIEKLHTERSSFVWCFACAYPWFPFAVVFVQRPLWSFLLPGRVRVGPKTRPRKSCYCESLAVCERGEPGAARQARWSRSSPASTPHIFHFGLHRAVFTRTAGVIVTADSLLLETRALVYYKILFELELDALAPALDRCSTSCAAALATP